MAYAIATSKTALVKALQPWTAEHERYAFGKIFDQILLELAEIVTNQAGAHAVLTTTNANIRRWSKFPISNQYRVLALQDWIELIIAEFASVDAAASVADYTITSGLLAQLRNCFMGWPNIEERQALDAISVILVAEFTAIAAVS